MRKVILFSILFLLIAPLAHASEVKVNISNNSSGSSSNVSVNSTSEGTSTTCVNGNCTTTGGSSHSKVCINGECTESDGDVEIKKDDGNNHLYISNSGTKNSTISATSTPKEHDLSEAAKQAEKIKEAQKKSQEKLDSIFEQIRSLLKRVFPFL